MSERAARPPAVCLMGPTASGKSAVALELARRLDAEIVSVDSAQVYRGMDIGTAKPDAAERARCAHHLIDLVSPEDAYSAARFRDDALAAMADIRRRGRLPLLVGGTMLYFKVLREGLSALPAADPALRAEIEQQAAQRGWPALHAELTGLDPQAAARLEPNDAQRIQRALEVVRLTGGPLAAAYARRDGGRPDWRFIEIALIPGERARLHARIGQRFEAMLAAGLVEEVVALRRTYRLHTALPAMRCVGYRQVWEMLEGRLPQAELRDRGIFATRQLAKRQLTWLRAMAELRIIDSEAADRAVQAARLVESALDNHAGRA